MKIITFIIGLAALVAAPAATAATLGLMTSAPTLGASAGTYDYFEFGSDGDLSMFGAEVDLGSALGTTTGFAEMGFAFGFSLADPEAASSGGFDIFDDDGLYLAGDLLALGFRSYAGTHGLIEAHFGSLVGHGAGSWTDTVLMTIVVPDGGDTPFSSFFDGDSRTGLVSLFAVTGDVPTPSPVPLPGGMALLAGGIFMLAAKRRVLQK